MIQLRLVTGDRTDVDLLARVEDSTPLGNPVAVSCVVKLSAQHNRLHEARKLDFLAVEIQRAATA